MGAAESLVVTIVTAAAVVTAIGVIVRTPPVRWVWCRLVTQPVSGWLTATIKTEVDPLRDEIAAVRTETVEHMRREEHDRRAIMDGLNDLKATLATHLPEASRRDQRIARIEAFLKLEDES